MFTANLGKGLINNAIGQFQAIKDNLDNGIAMCKREITKKQEVIAIAKMDINDLEDHVFRAEQMGVKISDIIGE